MSAKRISNRNSGSRLGPKNRQSNPNLISLRLAEGWVIGSWEQFRKSLFAVDLIGFLIRLEKVSQVCNDLVE
jgi:hypothetical protein